VSSDGGREVVIAEEREKATATATARQGKAFPPTAENANAVRSKT
jgi:hypothetical protein